jgi:hypothetical protein
MVWISDIHSTPHIIGDIMVERNGLGGAVEGAMLNFVLIVPGSADCLYGTTL